MMQGNQMCMLCDCVGLGLIIGGGVLVWGESGSLAIGAKANAGDDMSIYMTESGKFIDFYVMF